jgi:hypothetical protein
MAEIMVSKMVVLRARSRSHGVDRSLRMWVRVMASCGLGIGCLTILC